MEYLMAYLVLDLEEKSKQFNKTRPQTPVQTGYAGIKLDDSIQFKWELTHSCSRPVEIRLNPSRSKVGTFTAEYFYRSDCMPGNIQLNLFNSDINFNCHPLFTYIILHYSIYEIKFISLTA